MAQCHYCTTQLFFHANFSLPKNKNPAHLRDETQQNFSADRQPHDKKLTKRARSQLWKTLKATFMT